MSKASLEKLYPLWNGSDEDQTSPPILRKTGTCFCLLQTQRLKTFKYDFHKEEYKNKDLQRPPAISGKQSGNYRLRDTYLLDLVAFSQHRGSRTRIHLLPPALFLQSLAGGARVRHISLPFLHLPWCVCLLHPPGKSSVNRKSQLPGQAAVRISPFLSEMLTVLPALYCVPVRTGSF